MRDASLCDEPGFAPVHVDISATLCLQLGKGSSVVCVCVRNQDVP